MMKILIFSILIGISFSQVRIGYVYESCMQYNNYNFSESSGGTLYFSQRDKNITLSDHGLMNNSYIFDCLIVLKGKSQGTFPYKRFFGIHFRSWNFDTNSGSRYNINATQTYFPNVSANIKSICGDTCKTGCMRLIHPETKIERSLCGANQLTGTDYTEYFQQDYLMLKFYLLGGMYIFSDVNSTDPQMIMSRPNISFTIDFFSFYFGKCIDLTTEFQCIYTDRCIDSVLKCDSEGGMDCGIVSGGNSISYDQSICYQSICCCRNINNTQYNNLSTNKIMPFNSNVFEVENENTLGDGYHLRECR